VRKIVVGAHVANV